MPEKTFALEEGGPERLHVSWSGGFKDLALSLDGQPVATFENAKELKSPRRVPLPDGSSLDVQVANVFVFPELRLLRDGEPIPGSAADPATRHAAAWHVVAAVAVLNVVIGILVEAFDADFLRGIGAGWPSVFTGLVYGALAFFVRQRSRAALAVAVGLFVLDGIFVLVAGAKATGTPPVGGLVIRTFLLVPMLRGFGAIGELSRPRRRRPAARTPAAPPTSAPAARPPGAPSAAVPATGAASAARPAARVLSGEAEKRRLQLTERLAPAPAPTVAARGPITMKAKASVDAAASALRFVAHKCELREEGLHVTRAGGDQRDVPWTHVGRLVIRQLPPDPPWDAGVICDLVCHVGGRWEPVRIFGPTLVNYAALAGGASTSRLDNLRRLARHVRERNPGLAVDDDTLGFVEGRTPPPRLANTTELARYEAGYD